MKSLVEIDVLWKAPVCHLTSVHQQTTELFVN